MSGCILLKCGIKAIRKDCRMAEEYESLAER